MRINAINNSLYTVRNRNYASARKVSDTNAGQTQNPSFQGSGLKIGLGAAGAILGGLIIGGPVGAIIGAAVGIQGAQYAEDDEKAKNQQDKK